MPDECWRYRSDTPREKAPCLKSYPTCSAPQYVLPARGVQAKIGFGVNDLLQPLYTTYPSSNSSDFIIQARRFALLQVTATPQSNHSVLLNQKTKPIMLPFHQTHDTGVLHAALIPVQIEPLDPARRVLSVTVKFDTVKTGLNWP